jgi:prepilin-type N-terminal cleavage/methylation domain-containing protein
MSRLRSRRLPDDRGVSLVEMLVAIVVLSIVMGITTTAFITSMRNSTMNSERAEAQASNRVGLERVLRIMRQAAYPENADYSNSTVVWQATTERVSFYAHVKANEPVSRVVLEHQADGTIRMGVSEPDCSGGPLVQCDYTEPEPTQIVAKYVRNGPATLCQNESADHAVFRYYSAAPMGGGLVDITPTVTGTALQGVRLKDIASIGVELYTDKRPGVAAPDCELLSGTVKLRNWKG